MIIISTQCCIGLPIRYTEIPGYRHKPGWY